MKKLSRTVILLAALFLFSTNAFAQPTWQGGTPTINPEPFGFEFIFNLDQNATIYYIIFDYNAYTSGFTAPAVRSAAIAGPTGSRVATGVINYNTPFSDLTEIVSGLQVNTNYAIFITAYDGSNNASNDPALRYYLATDPCPEINIFSYLGQTGICINKGVLGVFTAAELNPMIETGILAGSEWIVDWGDGNTSTYTSATDDDFPYLTHTYSDITDCNYIATWAVENPCLKNDNASSVIVVHGRDIPSDGDGVLEVLEVGTNNNVILICEGTEATVQVYDNSTWNCQNPTVPLGLTALPNDDPRRIQFLYGEDPNSVIENTITGDVAISNLGDATLISGQVGPERNPASAPGAGSGETSEFITIPATAQEGEYFRVYMKNWNKCNWPDAEYVNTFIEIQIIHAPDPPNAPDVEDCFGSVGPLTAAPSEGGILNWYSDAALTTNVNVGGTFNHGHTAVGSYTYYVTETAGGCEGPAEEVVLTIHPLPDNTLPVSDGVTCEGDPVDVILSNSIAGTRYWLRNDAGNGILDGPYNGNGGDITFTFTPAASMTCNVLAEIIVTGCQDEELDLSSITVNELANITDHGPSRTRCEGQNTTFRVIATGPGLTYQWQVDPNTGTFIDLSDGGNYTDTDEYQLIVSNLTMAMDGYQYRCILETNGSCFIFSNPANLTVNPIPLDRNVVADDPYMCYNGSTNVVVQNSQNSIEYTLRIGTTDQSTQTGDGNNLNFGTGAMNSTTTYNVVAENTTTGCARDLSDTPTITINPELNVNALSQADICVDTDINLRRISRSGGSGTYSYSWTGTGGYTSTSRDPAPFANAITGTHSYTATVTDEGFLTTSTAGGDPTTCSGSDTETFEVHPLPIDRNVTIDHTQICYNTGTTVNIESSENGITYELWDNGLATSYGSQVGDGTTLHFPTGNLTSGVTFRVLASSPTTPSCEFELTDNPSVVVNANLGVVASVDDNDICAGTTINLFSAPGGGSGTYSFAWSGPDAYSSALEDPSDTPASEGLPHTYTVVLTDLGFTPTAPLPACTATDDIDVRVNLNPTANLTPAPTGICTNQQITVDGNPVAGTGTTLTHLWTVDTSPLSATDIADPDFLTGTPATYDLTYRVEDENGCFAEDNTTITVSGPTADIEADGLSAETAGICDNTNLTLDGNPTPNPTAIDNTTHRWTEGPVALTGMLTPMGPSAGAETPVFNSGTVGDYTYYYEVQDASGCFAYDTISITVSQVNATPSPAAPEPCAGQTVNINGNPTGGSGLYTVHTWTEDAANPELGTLTNANTQTPSFTATTPGTYTFDYYVEDNAGCSYTVNNYTIIVKAVPDLTNGLVNNICSGNSAARALSITNGPLVVTYAWTAPTYSNGTLTGGSAGSGAAINDVLENKFISSTETVTYSVTPTADGCSGPAENVVITVRPEPVVTPDQNTSTCSDIGINYEINVDNIANGLVEYTWVAPINSGGMTGGSLRNPAATGNISDTFHNITGSSQTATYAVTPSFNGCPGDNENIVINVKPEPVITANQNPFTCSSDALDYEVEFDNFDNPGDNVTLTWVAPTLDADPDFSGGSARAVGSASNISDTYVNTSNLTLQSTYNIVPRYDGCNGDLETVIIDVRPEPVINPDQTELVCSRTQTNLDILLENFTNPGDVVTFTWGAPVLSTTTNFSGGSARAIASSNRIQDTFINQTGIQQTATYTVTPYYNGCAGTAVDIVIEVDPEPVVTPGQEPPICSDVALNYQIAVSNVAAGSVSYTWAAPALAGGITGGSVRNPSATGNIGDTFHNETSLTHDATYTVTPTYGGCVGLDQTVVVKVAPEPVITAGQNPETCSQTPLNHYIALDNFAPGDGVLYRWGAPTLDADPDFSGGAARPAANGGNLTDSYTNKSNSTLQASYSIIPSLAGCDGNAETLIVDVKPEPEITAGQEVTVCSGEALDFEILLENFTNPGDNVTFTWPAPTLDADPDFSGGGSRPVGNSNNITDTYLNTSGSQQNSTYYITPTYNGCDGEVISVLVHVNPEPQMTSTDAETICSEEVPGLVFTSDIPATYNWEVTFISGSIIGTAVGETGAGNIPHTLINTGAVAGTVIYRVTPQSAAGCDGTAQNVTITVNAAAIATETNATILIAAGNPTPAGPTGLQVSLSGAAVAGAPAGWVVVDPFPAEGSFDDANSVSPIFTPSASQEAAGYVIVQYITNDPDGGAGPCLPDTAEVFIGIGELPEADAGNDTTMCFMPSLELKGWIDGAATTGTWTAIAGFGSGVMGPSTTTGTTVTATYTFGADEIGVDVITFRLETDDPDGAGPVPSVHDDKVVTINPLPVSSSVTGIDTVCVNTANLVYSVVLSPGSNYEWSIPAAIGTLDFGGTGLNSNMSIITSAAVGASDSLWVFERNQYGCVRDTIYKPVTVLEQSLPDPITGPTDVCAFSENVTYSVPNFPGSTYQWFVPVGAAIVTDPTKSSIDITFAQFSGQIRVVETNPGGCVTNHGPLMVTVNSLPISTINALPAAVCQGENVQFTAGPAGEANYEFFVNGVSEQSSNSEIFNSTSINNNDQVTVIVTTANGCSAESNPVQVTVYDLPTVLLESNDTTICAGTAVNFTANSASAVNYNFFLNGVSQQSGGQNFYTNSTLIDGDVINVDILSAFGCSGSSTDIIMTVFDLPVASIDGDHTICPGVTENLVVSVSNGLSPFDITIDNGIGNITGYLSGNNIPVTPAVSTTYNLTEITDANGCTSSIGPNITGSAVITHLDTVQILTQPKDAEVCEGVDTSFTVGNLGSGSNYEWYVSNTFAGPYAPVAASNNTTLDIIMPSSAEDGNYYYVVITGTCDSETSDTAQLSIQYDPISARDPFNAAVCEGFPTGFGVDAGITENPSFQWYLSTDGGGTWAALLDTAFYTGSSTDSLRISSAASRFDGYQYYVEITGNCAGTASSAAASLTVYERPEILEQPADTVVCELNPVFFAVNAGVTTNANYQWQVDERGGLGFQNIAEDSALVYSGHDQDTLHVLNPESRFNQYRYRVIVSGDCTPALTSSYVTLTVNEVPEITTVPVDEEICEDQSTLFSVNAGVTTGASYLWEVDMNTGTFNTIGMDSAVYSGHNTSTLILSSVPSSYDGYLYRVTVNGVCPVAVTAPDVTLTVNEEPEIAIQPVNDTVCDGDQAVFSVDPGVSTNPTYQWQVNKIGLWNNLSAADETSGDYSGVFADELFVNNPDLSYNNYRYRVVVSGTCTPSINSEAATLIVDTRPEISFQPSDITTCEDGTVEFVVQAGGTTEPVILWEYSDNSGTTWNDAALLPEVAVSNLPTLDVIGIPSSYDQYWFRATVSGKCPAAQPSAVAILTVLEKPEISTHPLSLTSCEQDTVMFTVDPGITTMPNFTWQYFNGATWLATSSAIYEGVNNDTLYVNGINSGLNGTRYRVLVSGSCFPDSISEEAILTVDERPEVIDQPLNAVICEGDNSSFSITTGVTTAPVITWEYNDGGWNTADGGAGIFADWTTNTLQLNAVPNTWNGVEFRAIVSNGCGPNDTSNVVMLTVNNRPIIDVQPVNMTTCEGIATFFFIDPGITTNPAYTWQVNDGVTGWQNASGGQYSGTSQDTLKITNPSSNMDGYEFRVILSGECTPTVTSAEVILSIEENPEITVQPVGDDICELTNTSFTVNSGVTTNPSYQWYVDDGSGGGMSMLLPDAVHSGTTAPSLNITSAPFAIDEYKYQVEVSGSCGNPILSDIIDLIVYKAPEITLEPVDSTICELKNASFTIETGDTDVPDIQWFENDGVSGWLPVSNGGLYTGATSPTLQIFAVDSAMNNYQYHAEVSNHCGGPVTSLDATLYVLNAADIWQQPSDSIVCENTQADFNVIATGTNLTYQWQVDQRGGAGFENIMEDSAGVYNGFDEALLEVLNPTSRFDNYRYRVIVSSTDCTPARISDYAELTIHEVAEIITPPSAKIICEEQSTVFSVDPGVTTNPSYIWEVDMNTGTFVEIGMDSAVYSGFNTSTLILSTVPSTYNGYLYRVTVGGICPNTVQSAPVTLTVNELPEIALQPENDTVCENDQAQFTVNPGVSTAPTYQWQVNKFGAWTNLTGADEVSLDYTGVTDQTLFVNDPDISYNNYRYRVIISGTCTPSVTSEAASLIIDTRPVVTLDPIDITICEGDNADFLVRAGATTEPVFSWTYSDDDGANWYDAALLPEIALSDNDTLSLSDVPSSYDGYWFRANISGKCPVPAQSGIAVLTVYERPEIAIQPSAITACEQDTIQFIVDPGVTTLPAYTWQYYNGATWLTLPPTIYQGVNNDTLQINGINSGINGTAYRVIVSGACSPDSISAEAVLTVDERPEVIGIPLDQTICENDGTYFGISTGATSSPNVSWEYFDGAWNTADAGDLIFTNWNTDTILLTNVDATWDGVQFRAIVSNGCGPNDTSFVATLTIKNRPLIDIDPIDATTCEGTATLFGIDAGITSDPTFNWEVNDGLTGWNPVFGAQYSGVGTDTLHLLAPNSSMNGYQYRVVLGGYCTPNDTSAIVTLTITENAEITKQPISAAICEFGDTLFYASPGVTTNPHFQWYVDDNSGSGWAMVPDAGVYSGATDSILMITGATFSMDNYLYQVEISGDCGAPVYSNIIELIVYKAPEITLQPLDTTTCELKNVSFTINTGDTETPMIQWFVDDGITGMMPISNGGGYVGSNSTTLQVFGVDSAMTGYRYEARVTNSCGGPLASDIATLTVNAAPNIWVQPVDSTICEGNDATFSVIATGENLHYEWFVDNGSTTTSIVNGSLYNGQGSPTLQLTNVDRTNHLNRYYVRITGDCNPWVQSNIAFLYINNPPEIQIQPENDTICEFNTASFSVNAIGDNLEYQWEESTDGVNFVPLTDGGFYIGTQMQNLNIFNVDRNYNGNKYRVQIIGTCTPFETSAEVELLVNTAPVITTQPDNITVCHGNEADFSVVAEGSELTYQWRVNKNDGAGYVNILDSDPDYTGALLPDLKKLNTDSDTENGYSYRVQVSGYCTPGQLSNPALLNVNSLPEIDGQPSDKQICEGFGTVFTAAASGPDLNYQWMRSTDGGSNWTVVSNDSFHDGAQTDQLTILDSDVTTMNGNLYRLDISSSCSPISSDVVELTVWSNPVPAISGDLSTFPKLCGGQLLTMDGSPAGGSGTYTSHLWSGDVLHINSTNTQITEFMTKVKGSYNINYTVTDDNGCLGSSSVVIENHRPTAQFSSDAVPKCGDLTVHFQNESSGETTGYIWDFDDGTSSNDVNPVHAFDNFDPTGLVRYYNIMLEALELVDGTFTCRDTSYSVVTIYPKVNPEITATPTSGCQPLEVYMETQPGASNYFWDYGDGTGENGSYTTYHTFANLGTTSRTFETVLQTTSAYGCIASDTVDIVVDPIPRPNFTASPGVQTFPEVGDAQVTFANATDIGPWTFVYDFGDGSTPFTTTSYDNVIHNYTQPGIYTVTLYTNIGECIDSASTVVTINPRPPVAAFTSILEGCHPLEVQFYNSSKYATSYTWQFGDGSISTEENPLHIFFQPGNFTVKLIANGPGGTDQTSVEIVVNPTPQVFFNYAPDSVFVNDKPVRFFNLTAYADRYMWDFGDRDSLTGTPDQYNNSMLADPTHVYMTEGWKDVLLIAENDYCIDSLLIPFAIHVRPAGELRFPNIFRPGDSPTGGQVGNLSDPKQKNSVFFPGVNKQVQEYHLYIYNRWGELIFQSDDINIGWDGFVKDSKAIQGVYIWKVTGIYSNGSTFSDAGDVTLVWQ